MFTRACVADSIECAVSSAQLQEYASTVDNKEASNTKTAFPFDVKSDGTVTRTCPD